MKMFAAALFVIAALSACSQSKEQMCLQSSRLDFKDPDSLEVIADLGTRGQGDSKHSDNFFWLRYKAKNSYGAYESGNMACTRNGKTWARDKIHELKATMDVQIYLMERLSKVITEDEAKKFVLESADRMPLPVN